MDNRNPIYKIMATGNVEEEMTSFVRPTKKKVKQVFELLNKHVWNGCLPEPKFLIKRTRGYWGLCVVAQSEIDPKDAALDKYEIVLTDRFPSHRFMVMVLAHEMTHLHEWVESRQLTHGPNFFKWKENLKKYKIPLRKSYPIRKKKEILEEIIKQA